MLDELVHFHVCRPAEFGYVTVAFHDVPNGTVIKEQLPETAERVSTCATVMWFAKSFEPSLLEHGIAALCDVIKSIELNTGTACLINLHSLMLPEVVEVGDLNAGRKIMVESLPRHAPIVSPAVAAGLIVWEGFDKRELRDVSGDIQQLYMQSAVWQGKAIRALAVGDTEFCVVASETWIETLAIRLAAELNRLAGSDIPDLKSEVIGKGLAPFITKWLGSKFLKGQWDHRNADCEFGRWHRDCWSVRNDVVHTGKHPTVEEARRAYVSANQLAWFISERAATLTEPMFAEVAGHFKGMSDIRKAKRKS